MTIGERIREVRQEKGLTQKQLGEKCEMADSAIRRYESDRGNPTLDTLKRIATALDVTVFTLIESTEYSNLAVVEGLDQALLRMMRAMAAQEGFSSIAEFYDALLSNKVSLVIVDDFELQLLHDFSQLNEAGKETASERVKELTELSKFKKHRTITLNVLSQEELAKPPQD